MFNPFYLTVIGLTLCQENLDNQDVGSIRERSFSPRIVGGEVTDIESNPWQVQVFFDRKFICGGSLLKLDNDENFNNQSNLILTAAHCLCDNEPGDKCNPDVGRFSIMFGSKTKFVSPYGFQNLTKFALHPDYNKLSLADNDIALFVLEIPITYSKIVSGIMLPDEAISKPSDPKACKASGFGKTSENSTDASKLLRQVFLPYINQSQCTQLYSGAKYFETDSAFCAGYVEDMKKDACTGDSGGPYVCKIGDSGKPKDFRQYGVVSVGIGCAREGLPGIYTNVPMYDAWIRENYLKMIL